MTTHPGDGFDTRETTRRKRTSRVAALSHAVQVFLSAMIGLGFLLHLGNDLEDWGLSPGIVWTLAASGSAVLCMVIRALGWRPFPLYEVPEYSRSERVKAIACTLLLVCGLLALGLWSALRR